jgi:hypothetical protein
MTKYNINKSSATFRHNIKNTYMLLSHVPKAKGHKLEKQLLSYIIPESNEKILNNLHDKAVLLGTKKVSVPADPF